MKHIYFSTPGLFSFVKKDLTAWEKKYKITLFLFSPAQKWKTPFTFLAHAWSLLRQGRKVDIYICKFAGYSSFLPMLWAKFRKKPCLLITAGTESAGLPSIHYGNFDRWVLGKFTEWSLRGASHIAPVHRSLMLQDYTYHPEIHPQQGVQYFCKNLKTPFTEIHYGFDAQQFINENKTRIPNSFAMIAAGFHHETVFLRKGVELMLAAAKALPRFQFTIIGYEEGKFQKEVPQNVRIIAKIPQTELITLLNEHEFYCQVSRFEGFPNALCEAMLCGCIPIGSTVSAIPEIIGNVGFILTRKDENQFIELLQTAVQCDKIAYSNAARQRVIDHYLSEVRQRKLENLIENLLQP